MGSASVNPFWAYLAAGALVVMAMAAVVLAPYAAPPSPGRITGVLFPTPVSLNAIARADDLAEIVETRLGGRLVYVVYRDPLFPARIAWFGAAYSFDAVAAGCHGADTSRTSARPQPRREKHN